MKWQINIVLQLFRWEVLIQPIKKEMNSCQDQEPMIRSQRFKTAKIVRLKSHPKDSKTRSKIYQAQAPIIPHMYIQNDPEIKRPQSSCPFKKQIKIKSQSR